MINDCSSDPDDEGAYEDAVDKVEKADEEQREAHEDMLREEDRIDTEIDDLD